MTDLHDGHGGSVNWGVRHILAQSVVCAVLCLHVCVVWCLWKRLGGERESNDSARIHAKMGASREGGGGLACCGGHRTGCGSVYSG